MDKKIAEITKRNIKVDKSSDLLKKAFYELREQAKDLPDMTLEEINEEIATVRRGSFLYSLNSGH